MRTLGYVGLPPGEGDKCENLALMCIDFRFHKRVSETLWFAGYRDFDLLALPGGSKAILDEASREVTLAAIDRAVQVHSVERLLIVDHLDCRAWGGSAAFASSDEEQQAHEDGMREAAGIVKTRFPEMEIVLVYVSRDRVVALE